MPNSPSNLHTAVGDKEIPDEVIHLAASLQLSGFNSVVGTLWEVDDSLASSLGLRSRFPVLRGCGQCCIPAKTGIYVPSQ
ncbi:hypothetical protein P692DRAFT_201476347 [Suillus brevipes Sb2]|nr:hypothetical protein P692DRAFT_201476347 [Suillus brevipes Sb2]